MIAEAPTRPKLLHAALWYAAHGWHVFPLIPNSKRPAVEDWETAATTDRASITATWSRDAYNIGIACGPSGLLVIDLDRPKDATDKPPAPWDTEPGIHDGADLMVALAERAGERYPDHTHTVSTASGGTHLYFAQPPGVQLRNTTGRLGWKIDTRGHGGYVVAAGSVVDGHRYFTVHTARPAALPDWISLALTQPRHPERPTAPDPDGDVRDGAAYARAALRAELDRVLSAAEGTRNHTLNAAAYSLGQLCAAGLLDHGQVTTALLVAATHIGLSEHEAERTIASGLGSGTAQPRHLTPAPARPGSRPRRTA
jgi:hypothetical protein